MSSIHQRALRNRWAWAATGYALAALVITYPLVFNFTTHLAGAAGGASDTYEFVWSTWWWPHALFDLRQNPAHITAIQYPGGTEFPLLPLMSQPFLLALPVTALAGPAVAYNAVFLLSFVLCGLAGYALCVELSGNRRAAFLGGLIWAFFPNKLGHAVTGHLFQLVVFALPMAALAWWRLWQAPSVRRAVLAALALALASTVHPIYLAYFAAPLVAVGTTVSLWETGRAFWSASRVRPLALAVGLYAVFVLPVAAPALVQAGRGGLDYLAPESGTVELSLDALSLIIPAPRHPLVAGSPLAGLARDVVSRENETIGYVGWATLLLSALGIRRQPRASRVWWALAALATVLALGPLLKFGGGLVRIPVEGTDYAVPMPYALFGNLPFFEWSRTPGRLSALLLLSLAVLAALGYASLEARPGAVSRTRFWAATIAVVILAEYLVVFPLPLTPAAQPGPVAALRAERDGRAVLHLPLRDNADNQRALYWQTQHEHPLIGGRVYRDVPGGDDLANFLAQLVSLSAEAGIVAAVPESDRLSVLNALGVGWVLFDTQADMSLGMPLGALEARLGLPLAKDDGAALFAVPASTEPLSPEALIWAVGSGWAATTDGLRPPAEGGVVYIYSAREGLGQLQFALRPEAGPARLAVSVNGHAAGEVILGRAFDDGTISAKLARGLNVIGLQSQPLAGRSECGCEAVPGLVVRSVQWQWAGSPVETPTFGEILELRAYSFEHEARAGERLVLNLAWRMRAPVGEDLIFFVHLVNAAGEVAAQVDGPPLAGALTTSTWPSNAIIADEVVLALPADLPLGDYALTVGWYRWPSLERLSVSGGEVRDERAVLGVVTIGP